MKKTSYKLTYISFGREQEMEFDQKSDALCFYKMVQSFAGDVHLYKVDSKEICVLDKE